MLNKSITIAENTIEPDSKKTILLPLPEIYTQAKIELPVHVFQGKKPGPKIFVIGTIHGDELNTSSHQFKKFPWHTHYNSCC